MISGIFGQFNAGYGEEVALHYSSGDGVWLSIKQRQSGAAKLDLKGEPIDKPGEAAAHLTPAQAVVLRAALDNYLAQQQEG